LVNTNTLRIADPNANSWYVVTFGVARNISSVWALYSSTNNITYTIVPNAVISQNTGGVAHYITCLIPVTNNPTFLQVRALTNGVTLSSSPAAPVTGIYIRAYLKVEKVR
jgi:hypothetical protein